MKYNCLFITLTLLSCQLYADDHESDFLSQPQTDPIKKDIVLIYDQFSIRESGALLSHGELMANIIKGKYHPELIFPISELRSWEKDLDIDLALHLNIPADPSEYYEVSAPSPLTPKTKGETPFSRLWLKLKSVFSYWPHSSVPTQPGSLKRERLFDFHNEKDRVAIVNNSNISLFYNEAERSLNLFYSYMADLPLFIVAAGNDANRCTEESAIINRYIGHGYNNLASYFFDQPDTNFLHYVGACSLFALAAMDAGKKDYFIHVIGDLGNGSPNKPAGYFKDNTVAAPFETCGYEGTSISTAYVTAVANMIHARAPELSPPEIAQIIFKTADKKGISDLNETWGHGVVNPGAAMALMDKLGYPRL